MKYKIFMSALILYCGMNCVSAASIPHGVSADHRVKLVQYDPNNIVILKGKYGYQTQIVFAPNEIVQNVSIGDSLAWQVVPVNQYLFIKPVASSKTNMTVLTNLNSYNFELNSENSSISPTYKLQFVYLPGGYEGDHANAVNTFDPEKLNWQYSFTGNKNLAPIEAFDNDQFTFFKFKNNGMSHLPAIFTVDDKRHETLINYHVQGNYVVVHSVAKQFTFRNGSEVTSVYNDFAIGDAKNI